MKKILLSCLTATTLFSNLLCFAQPSAVPLNFFGINGWMNDKIGNATNVYDCNGLSQTYSVNPVVCALYGKFDLPSTGIIAACPTKITSLYTTLIRYGGAMNDVNMPTREQFINEIDAIRSLGAEPIIQIPYGDGNYTATDAYNLMYYINVTRGKKIKYVEIGNEPDLYIDYPTSNQLRADFIANYFRPIATQVKLADNSVKIIGPSNASYNATVYGFLLNSTNSAWIGGLDANSNYYLDIVDFHYYPYSGTQTVGNVQGNPMTTLDGYLSGLVSLMNTVNAGRGGSLLQYSISEININYKNPSTNGVANYGANGFIAGQWMAECYSVILSNGQDASSTNSKVAFVTPWSFHESGGNQSDYDLGLLDGSNPCTTGVYSERSTYIHLALMGQYFKNGTYYKGGNNSLTNVKQFGTYLANGYYAIMILNEEQSTVTTR